MQNNSKSTIKRKIIVVNKGFQYKFSLLLMIPTLIIQTLFWIAIEIFFFNMIEYGKAHNLPVGHNFYRLLALQKKELMLILFITSFVVAIIMFIWGLYLSHRIAGPLHKFDKYMKEASSLEHVRSNPLFFRKKDFFQNLPDTFNDFIKRLSENSKRQ